MPLPRITYAHQQPADARRRLARLSAQIETPHDRVVYGQSRRVEPTFCDAVIGDGAVLLVVTPVRTVPEYHAILVDSSWARPCSRPLSRGIEADLEDPDRRDLLVEVLKDVCGDGDRWHEENGEELIAPKRCFPGDMGFYWGVETLGPDGLLPADWDPPRSF
jgi:hypothetical protein